MLEKIVVAKVSRLVNNKRKKEIRDNLRRSFLEARHSRVIVIDDDIEYLAISEKEDYEPRDTHVLYTNGQNEEEFGEFKEISPNAILTVSWDGDGFPVISDYTTEEDQSDIYQMSIYDLFKMINPSEGSHE